MPIIEARELVFQYNRTDDAEAPPALRGLNLQIERGEFVAVVGHNGSGKSTFAKLLNGILTPTSGAVYVNGMDTRDESLIYDIRACAGMVFQNPDNQIVATVVEEDVAFAPENLGLPREEIRRRVDAALDAVGMRAYMQHAPHMLSGGQKQRIAIAGVLAMEPQVLVLDEPTAMLDPRGRAEVMQTVQKLNRERGMTVVLITHHMDEAALASRVVVMSDGQMVMEGAPEDIFAREADLRRYALEPPQTVQLLCALNRHGANLSPRLLDVEACAQAVCAWLEE